MHTDQLFTKYYFAKPGFQNGTAEFHQLVEQFIPAGGRILEIGSGPSNATTRFLAGCGSVTGVDVSEEVSSNSWLAEARVYDGGQLPFPNDSFRACVSNYVLEHVPNPEEHFREVGRVLQPGGVYCFRTPNLWHYVTLGSKLLPHRAHLRLSNRLRGYSEDAHDPYPTVYAANTPKRIRELAQASGLSPVLLRTTEKEPAYGKASALLFFPMMAYERFVNSSPLFAPIRINILAVLRKTAG